MKFKSFCLIAGIATLGVSPVEAAPIVYDVDIVGAIWGSIVGTITTDGKIGPLANTDIVNWDLAINTGTAFPHTSVLLGPPSAINLVNQDFPLGVLVGTPTELDFSFEDTTPGLFDIQMIGPLLNVVSFQDFGWSNNPGGQILIDAQGGEGFICCGAVPDRIGKAHTRFATPLPPTLSLYGAGLGVMGLAGWWRKRKAQGAA